MWRYVGVTAIIGLLVSVLVFFLFDRGVFAPLAERLFAFYDSIALFPPSEGSPRTTNPVLHVPVIAMLAFGLAWVAIDVPRVPLKLVLGFSSLLLIIGLSPTLALYGFAFEPLSGLAAGALGFVGGFIYSRTDHGQRKQSLSAILGSRVSTQTFHQVLGSAHGLNLDGERRELSVLTCQFFNQPEMLEKLDPSDVVEITNLFLKSTVEHLLSLGGYLDESNPASIRFLFGVHNDNSNDHAIAAAQAGIELRQRLDNLSKECEARWHQPLQFGIGISSGTIALGVFGSASHVYFSGMGADIDLAQRLSRANERYGSQVLLSARSYMLSKDEIEVRPMDMIYLPKSNVVAEVYELLERRDALNDNEEASRDSFWQGMIYFRNGNYESALEMFSRARISDQTDAPLEHYISRTQEYLVHPERIPAGAAPTVQPPEG
jgi:class 3 adenylate cyclase